MDAVFPSGFPAPTAFYLTFYVLTLVLHVVFMNYVLFGTAYVAWTGFAQRRLIVDEAARPIPLAILIDWLPVMLTGVITAGVAPLLFLQILYRENFYTANLLLFHRWMSILPVLIVGFYALYLLRSQWLKRQWGWLQTLVAVVPFLAVAFTGYSWTENHLLSLRNQAYWAEFYGREQLFYGEAALIPRLLVWLCGAGPAFTAVLGWQILAHKSADAPSRSPLWLPRVFAVSVLLTGLAGAWFYAVADEAARRGVWGPMAWPYFVLACLGLAVQGLAWWRQRQNQALHANWLLITSAGLALTLIGMTACREAIRLETLGPDRLSQLYEQHERASRVGGLVAFLLFFVLNAGLVTLCFWLVRRGLQASIEPPRRDDAEEPKT